jgi:reelin-like protein/PEP-CTERM motif-containing protein
MLPQTLFKIAAATLSSVGLAALAAPSAQAQQVFFDDFDGTTAGGGFSNIQNGTSTTLGSLFSNNVLYFSSTDGTDRFAATPTLDLSGATGSQRAFVAFFLRYEGKTGAVGETDVDSNFDHLDGTGDEIQAEYSTDGGGTWTSISSSTLFPFSSDGYNQGNNFRLVLPSAAWVSSVQIRVFQVGANSTDMGVAADQWAVDNFEVLVAPEPGTWAFFGLGAAGLGAWVNQRRRGARAKAGADAAKTSA